MKVEVLLFSLLRDLAGTDRIGILLPVDECDLGEVLEVVRAEIPSLSQWQGPLLLAVDGEFADTGTRVADGSEIALMPPVQGG